MTVTCQTQHIKLIYCPSTECGGCRGNLLPHNCEASLSVGNEFDLVILQPDKKMIHLRDSKSPENTSTFESVFIEDFNAIGMWEDLIGVYVVDSYLSLFFKDTRIGEIRHHSVPRVKTSLEYSLIGEMSTAFNKSFNNMDYLRLNFQDRLNRVQNWIERRLSVSLSEISPSTRRIISTQVANTSTALCDFFPLVLDECVEEIYLDRPEEYVYFDHSCFGRVKSNFVIDEDTASRLCTLFRAESNLHLDRKNPSLKTDLVVNNVQLRVSTSLPPLSPDGMNFEIRRARVRPFTIIDLIRNNTLDFMSAALLIFAINSRLNITITGEPGTGKTTLMNALDFTTPKIWRKVYIEDVIESRTISGNHQVRFKVSPVDEQNITLDKANEIVKCLHRSPDYMILGEIQTINHSRALFQAIASGLRSIQTCHSNVPSSLVTRWTVEHGISPSSLALMDLIVSLKRPNPGHSKRYVNKIVEICRKENSGLIDFAGINEIYSADRPDEIQDFAEKSTFGLLEDARKHIEIIADKLKDVIENGIELSTMTLQSLHVNVI